MPAGAGENNPRQWFEAVLGFHMQAGYTATSLEPFQKESKAGPSASPLQVIACVAVVGNRARMEQSLISR